MGENKDKNTSIYERVQRETSSDSFEPVYSTSLKSSYEKFSSLMKKTTNTYKSEKKRFGGKPLPWK